MKKIEELLNFVNKPELVGLEKKLQSPFESLPKLPAELIRILVVIAPYLAIIGGVLNLLSLITFLPVTLFYPYLSPFAAPFYQNIVLTIVGAVVTSAFLIAAYNPLKLHHLFGWRLIFWSANIGFIISLLSGNLFGAIIGILISWYFLYQVRPSYH